MRLKKIIVLIFVCFVCIGFCFSEEILKTEPYQNPEAGHRIFRTDYFSILFQLDTTTGKLWIVEYNIENDSYKKYVFNSENLAEGKPQKQGRFTMYPTWNKWVFILVDQIDGTLWRVDWSFDKEKNSLSVIR